MKLSRHIGRLRRIALIAMTTFIAGSCIKEDLSDCGLVLRFRYDYNMDATDKFPTDISKLNVYVFDENGTFVGEFQDEGDHLDQNYCMKLNFKPGKYDIYTWAELCDDYRIASLAVNSSTFDQARLDLVCDADNSVSKVIKPLYHGQVTALEVVASDNEEVLVSLIKNTNLIRVTAKGLPLGTGSPAFTCRIEGDNAVYKFDNSPTADGQVTYKTQSRVEAQELKSDFTVMRLVPSGQSRLIVEYNPVVRSGATELFNENLIGLICNTPGIDLDRQDIYDIVIEFDYTMTAVTITVNGWTTVLGGQVIG